MNTFTSLALIGLAACSHRSVPPIPAPVPDAAAPVPDAAALEPDAATSVPAVSAVPAHLEAAVASSQRPSTDRDSDAGRHPAQVMSFAGVQPGHVVIDLMAGRGYYSELFAHAVGPHGRVYAQNNDYVVQRFADGPLSERLSRPGLKHVVRLDVELEDIALEPQSVDIAFMGLFYHDAYWMQVDRAAMNAAIFSALKPGGAYVITDHHAQDGSGTDEVKSLHRIEDSVLIADVQAAGFVLAERSDILANPDDPRTGNVFDESLRGATDRFLLRFVKPPSP